jgi:hypothetical protein
MINNNNQIENLVNRLKEKEVELKDLNSKVTSLNQLNESLLLKLKEVRGQVRLLKGKKENYSSRSSNKAVIKRNRSKKIFGILKNGKRYKLGNVEVSFLKDIQYLEKLSEKQLKWYRDICQRGFTKKKTNYNKQT